MRVKLAENSRNIVDVSGKDLYVKEGLKLYRDKVLQKSEDVDNSTNNNNNNNNNDNNNNNNNTCAETNNKKCNPDEESKVSIEDLNNLNQLLHEIESWHNLNYSSDDEDMDIKNIYQQNVNRLYGNHGLLTDNNINCSFNSLHSCNTDIKYKRVIDQNNNYDNNQTNSYTCTTSRDAIFNDSCRSSSSNTSFEKDIHQSSTSINDYSTNTINNTTSNSNNSMSNNGSTSSTNNSTSSSNSSSKTSLSDYSSFDKEFQELFIQAEAEYEESPKPNCFSHRVLTFDLPCDSKGYCDETNFKQLLDDNSTEEFIKVRLPCNIDAECLWRLLRNNDTPECRRRELPKTMAEFVV